LYSHLHGNVRLEKVDDLRTVVFINDLKKSDVSVSITFSTGCFDEEGDSKLQGLAKLIPEILTEPGQGDTHNWRTDLQESSTTFSLSSESEEKIMVHLEAFFKRLMKFQETPIDPWLVRSNVFE
jgi:hypothetical protein